MWAKSKNKEHHDPGVCTGQEVEGTYDCNHCKVQDQLLEISHFHSCQSLYKILLQ